MAGYNRGIVATRKLNENNKARLGRGNDTEIRKVDGKKSHVNAFEAYLIDVYGKAGEKFAKEVGSGTRNPLTGLKEYDFGNWDHNKAHLESSMSGTASPHDLGTEYKESGEGGESAGLDAEVHETKQAMWGEQKTYDEIQAMDLADRTEYLKTFGLEGEDMGLISEFEQDPFTFLGEEKTTALGGVDLGERQLGSSRDLALGALGSQQATLSRTTGRGLETAGQSRDIATSRSGLATSGTITQAYESQKKDLFQDYAAGMGDIKRERAGVEAGYDFGMEGFGLDRTGIQTAFDKGTYQEKRRQREGFYEDIMSIKQFT